MSLRVAGAVMGGAVLLAAAAASRAAPPPPSAFGRLPAFQSVAISPDGKSVAMIAGSAEDRQLSIATIDQPKAVTMSLGNVRADRVAWAGDNYILVRITKHQKDNDLKYAYNISRYMIFDRQGHLKTWLLNNSPESTLSTGTPIYRLTYGDKPSAFVQGADQHMDTATNNTRFNENHDIMQPALYKVDVTSGHGAVVERGDYSDWVIDHAGEARGRITPVATNGMSLRPDDRQYTVSGHGKHGGWRNLSTVQKRGFALLGYSDPEDALYWLEEDGPNGEGRIHRADLNNGETTVMPTPPTKGEPGLLFDPYTDELLGVTDSYDQDTVAWTDPKLKAYQTSLARAFKGKTVTLTSWSSDKSHLIVAVSDSSEPTAWYLFEPGAKSVSLIGDEYPELKGAALGVKTFVTYKARDGLEIPAYVHMPPGGGTKNLPLIVFPHGGPAARDDDDFDWWAQSMASMGYVVLQPQFRGSAGFGYAFRRAGRQEWGGKMQTDLVDGVNSLVGQGVVDPKRVCIVGASYGGYAALESMTLFPEVYKCAVSVNGVSDPGQLVVQLGRLFGGDPNDLLDEFGESRADVASASPAKHLEAIKGPILMIYSSDDTTVPNQQTLAMQDRLQKAGKESRVLELPGDDHYLGAPGSRTRMLTAIDEFLAKNLPVAR